MRIFILTLFLLATPKLLWGQVIDMHLHSYTEANYRGGRPHPAGIPSPATAAEHRQQTLDEMDKHGIEWAVVSGSLESVRQYCAADSRFIPAYADGEGLVPVDTFEQLIKGGEIRVFGEIMAVYQGRTLNDPLYAPYLALCEQYGIPVAYHTGGGPPMTPYTCCPDFRIALGDPLLIEDVLVKYPKLKVYLMHGGEVFYRHALRMMSLYRHLYIDLGVLLWVDPIVGNYATELLREAQQAKLLDRVMFGTDQMMWPGSISASLKFLDSLDFLSDEEKQGIKYRNAHRFLGLK